MVDKIKDFKQFLRVAGEQIEKLLKKKLLIFQITDDDGKTAVLEIVVHRQEGLKLYGLVMTQKISYTEMTPGELRTMIKDFLAPMVKNYEVKVSEKLDLDLKESTIRILRMMQWLFDANEYICQTLPFKEHVAGYLSSVKATDEFPAEVRDLASKVLEVLTKRK